MSNRDRFFRYILVGCASYVFVTGMTYLLHRSAGLPESVSFAGSLVLVSLFNVVVLKVLVFRSEASFVRSGLGFLFSSFLMRCLEFVLFLALFKMGVHYLIGSTVAMAVGAVSKFILLSKVVFKV